MKISDMTVSHLQMAARIGLVLALMALAAWIGRAFIPAILWAGVIAVAVDPLRRRLLARWPGRHESVALFITVAMALLVIVPLIFGLTRAFMEAHGLAASYANAVANGIPVPAWLETLPYGSATAVRWWQDHLATPAGAAELFGRLKGNALMAPSKEVGGSILHRAIIFGFSMLILFFVLRDRDSLVRQLSIGAERAFGPSGVRIGTQIFASVRGAIDGLVLVGLAEGALMAVAYVIAAVPHPILLGMLTAVGAMIPFGLLVVMLIALALLVVKSAMAAVIAVGIFGCMLNFVADHFVRPLLIGGVTRLPFIWVLIGILGGVETVGLLGLFVGPAVMAALILVWRDFVSQRPDP